MKNWRVDFHRKAKEEFDELSESIREKFLMLFTRIESSEALSIPSKNVKFIEDGLWELRVRCEDGIARSIYVTGSEKNLRILVVFVKKTQKTPREIIELAHKRRRE